MAIATNIHAAAGSKTNSFFAVLGEAFANYARARSRADKVAALNAKSDAELAQLGIKREEIPAYVFRDLFYI